MPNRNKRALPLGFAVVGLLVVLAGLGIVSGLWSKNLVINGQVETGDLQVDWVVASSGDEVGADDCTGPAANPWNPLFPCPAPDKDVGSMDCFIDEEDAQILHFIVENGYPSYEADCEVEFQNTGSIPFNVIGFQIGTGGGLTNCVPTLLPQSQIYRCDQLKIGFFDNVGLQVDPGDQPGSSVRIHVEQAAAQSVCTGTTTIIPVTPPFPLVQETCDPDSLVTYEFTIKLCVAQWNEQATYEQCVLSDQHEGPESILLYTGNASIETREPGLTLNSLKAHYESQGHNVDYTSSWPASLSSYSLVYIHGPGGTDDSGANFFSAAQKAALSAYMAAGGRVVVSGDHSGFFGIDTVNDLLTGLGSSISQNADLVAPNADACAPMTDVTANGATAGVSAVDQAATSSLTGGTSLVRVDAPSTDCGLGGSLTVPGATFIARDGRLVVMGDANILDDFAFSDPVGDGNNADLADALLNY